MHIKIMLHRTLATLSNQNGATAVLTAFAMVALLGLAALSVDIGYVTLTKAQLQTAADQAALAGAQNLIPGRVDTAKAITDAKTYAAKSPGRATDTVVADPNVSGTTATIQVTTSRTVPTFFARVFNNDENTLSALAMATVTPASGIPNAPPFVIGQSTVNNLDYTEQYTMHIPSNDHYVYGPYEFDYCNVVFKNTTSFDDYLKLVEYGYSETCTTDTDLYYYGPSSGGQQSVDAFYERTVNDTNTDPSKAQVGEQRLMLIPVVKEIPARDTRQYSTRGLEIVGFVGFFLEEVHKEYGKKFWAKGRFVQVNVPGSTGNGGNYYGLNSIQLIK